MDRTNISILLATALLGVLLYIVRQIGNTGIEAVAPLPREPSPEVAAAGSTRVVAAPQTTESALPIIDGAPALKEYLDSLGLNGEATVDDARRWYEQRGFIGANPLLGPDPDSSLREYYESLDEATLEVMGEAGDVGASHELADRARLTDPFGAQKWLGTAAAHGSIKAFLQIASFQETLADVRPEDFQSDPDFMRELSRVGGRDPETRLRQLAFVNALTAIRDGGEPVMDNDVLNWVDELGERIPVEQRRQACSTSLTTFIGLGSARRSAGIAPVTTAPPPVFMSRQDADRELPCEDTLNPIVDSLDLSNCGAAEVLDGRGELRVLYVCIGN